MLKIAELCVTLHGILEKSLIRMKKIKTTYLLIATLLGLTACSQTDDTTVTLYDDAAIGSFTLGNVKRVVNGVKSTVAGSTYTFHIDQMTRTIYNTDSLPVGCDVSRVVCSIATYNNSGAFLISEDETTMTYYNGTDSIDFTKPRKFRVIASSGNGYNDYTIKVNVHKQVPDSIVWNTSMRRDLPGAESTLFESKTVMKNDVFVCLVDNNSYYVLSESTDPLGPWDSKPVTFPFEPQVNSLTATSDALYMLDENGQLFKSTDMGDSWSDCGVAWHSLIGAYGNKALGVKNDGGTWMHDQYPQGDDFVPTPLPQRFPVSGMSQLVMASNEWTSSQQAMMMGGLLANGSCSNAVWGYDGETWGLINDAPGTQALPALHDALMFPYYTYVVAPNGYTPSKQVTWIVMGGKHPSGDLNTVSYVSRNQCINWSKGENGVQLPAHVPAFSGAQAFTFSRVQPRLLSYNPGQTTPISEWDCPYIYIMGGNAASGAALNSIWEGVLTRLTYKPVF